MPTGSTGETSLDDTFGSSSAQMLPPEPDIRERSDESDLQINSDGTADDWSQIGADLASSMFASRTLGAGLPSTLVTSYIPTFHDTVFDAFTGALDPGNGFGFPEGQTVPISEFLPLWPPGQSQHSLTNALQVLNNGPASGACRDTSGTNPSLDASFFEHPAFHPTSMLSSNVGSPPILHELGQIALGPFQLPSQSRNWSHDLLDLQLRDRAGPTAPTGEGNRAPKTVVAESELLPDLRHEIMGLGETFQPVRNDNLMDPGRLSQWWQVPMFTTPLLHPPPSGREEVAGSLEGMAYAVQAVSSAVQVQPSSNPVPPDSNSAVILSSRQPTVTSDDAFKSPTTQTWSHHRLLLKFIYMDNNMPLPDVIDYMAEFKNFHATKNVYKKQFREWGWIKYARSKPGDCRRRKKGTCVRGPAHRLLATVKAKEADQTLENALHHWQFLLEADFARDPAWAADRFRSEGFFSQPVSNFDQGLQLRGDGDPQLGEKFMLHAKRTFRDSVREITMQKGFHLLFSCTKILLRYKQWSRFAILVCFLESMASTMPLAHNLAQIASTLSTLLRLNSTWHLMQFVSEGHQVLLDFMSKVQTTTTATALLIRQFQLENRLHMGILPIDVEWWVRKLVQEHDALVAQAETEGDFQAAFDLRGRAIQIQRSTNTYLGDFAGRCRAYRDRAYLSGIGDTEGSFADWSGGDLHHYIQSTIYLCDYFLLRQPASIKDEIDFDLFKAVVAEAARKDDYEPPTSEMNHLCSRLRDVGMDCVADDINRLWQGSKYIQEMASVEEGPDELSLFDDH